MLSSTPVCLPTFTFPDMGGDYFSRRIATNPSGSLSPIITNTLGLSLEDTESAHKRVCRDDYLSHENAQRRKLQGQLAVQKGHSFSHSDTIPEVTGTLLPREDELRPLSAMEPRFSRGEVAHLREHPEEKNNSINNATTTSNHATTKFNHANHPTTSNHINHPSISNHASHPSISNHARHQGKSNHASHPSTVNHTTVKSIKTHNHISNPSKLSMSHDLTPGTSYTKEKSDGSCLPHFVPSDQLYFMAQPKEGNQGQANVNSTNHNNDPKEQSYFTNPASNEPSYFNTQSKEQSYFNPTPKQEEIALSNARSMPPTLTKQLTLPTMTLAKDLSFNTIKSMQIKRIHSLLSVDYAPQILALLPSIHYETEANLHSLLSTQLVLTIDIRPFTDFVQSHVKNAVNICIPSTLLKRPNFTLSRCIASLPGREKTVMNLLFNAHDRATIVIYDHEQNTSNLFHVCNKFKTSSLFDPARHVIHLVNSPIATFRDHYPEHFESASAQSSPIERLPQALNSDGTVSNMLPPIVIDKSINASPSLSSQTTLVADAHKGTPVLQKFILPKTTAGSVPFKIRHNEELMTSNPFEFSTSTSMGDGDAKSSTLHQNKLNFFKLRNLPADLSVLPSWLRATIYGPDNTQSNKINADFFALEKMEQSRLVNALFLDKSRSHSLGSDDEVKISRGIEFGHKNRYKDIFLFEHSRVKLDSLDSENDTDYINASYLNPIRNLGELTKCDTITKHLKSVATQGPLEQTRGDFWKCIFNLKAVLILSLTDEIENGVVKCLPFWKSGVYISHQDTINVVLHAEYKVNEHLTLRMFQVSMADDLHEVLQIHLTSWPDMGTILQPMDLIQIVRLKSYVLERMSLPEEAYPSVVHCSAGCGRTGTLCTIDTMLSIFKNNGNTFDLSYDPVYDMVNNFRRQRISMVQNLGQYYLIYDVILAYILTFNKPEMAQWDALCGLKIVDLFLDRARGMEEEEKE